MTQVFWVVTSCVLINKFDVWKRGHIVFKCQRCLQTNVEVNQNKHINVFCNMTLC